MRTALGSPFSVQDANEYIASVHERIDLLLWSTKSRRDLFPSHDPDTKAKAQTECILQTLSYTLDRLALVLNVGWRCNENHQFGRLGYNHASISIHSGSSET